VKVALYHNLPPGGALRALYEFVRRTGTEHEYHLFTLDPGPLDNFAYARHRAEQHDLSPFVVASSHYSLVPAAARLLGGRALTLAAPWLMDRVQRTVAADINGGDFDVALVNSCSIAHSPGLLRSIEIPSLYYMQEPRRRSFEAGYQQATMAEPVVRRLALGALEAEWRRRDRASALAAGRIACNSCYSAESIQRAYGRDASVCYLAVDTDVFDLGPRDGRGTSVMSVGALDAIKGHELVVQAVAMLPPASRPAVDIVYERQDPVYRAELEALAASNRVDLRLHAGISDAQLAALYRQAAATVVAARLEPFGLVPLESMACGTPVLAIREAGYRESVEDGVNGHLVERSASGIAAGIAQLAAGSLGRTPAEIRASVVSRWGWDGAVKRQLEQLALAAEGERGSR
jgi:glycosyltransferase involved in cell wall biosynthesis